MALSTTLLTVSYKLQQKMGIRQLEKKRSRTLDCLHKRCVARTLMKQTGKSAKSSAISASNLGAKIASQKRSKGVANGSRAVHSLVRCSCHCGFRSFVFAAEPRLSLRPVLKRGAAMQQMVKTKTLCKCREFLSIKRF